MTILSKTTESESVSSKEIMLSPPTVQRIRMSTASVGPDGKVRFEAAKEPEASVS